MVAVCIGLGALSAAAQASLSAPSDARVAFQATGPAGMKIEGATAELTVVESDANVTLEVPLGGLKTGIDLRDQHMREKYLEVPRYPSASLVVARSALALAQPGAQTEADAPATLKLHGQVRPVTVHYQTKADAGGLLVHGNFHIKMTDFGITVPSYLGVTVKPDVDVNATFHVHGG
jgi:polyisoprenoid-binding protein YceI